MRSLHVAALPFPSPQGTQALLHSMLSALSAAGHETHLACYAHGAPAQAERSPAARYAVHRLARTLGVRSLRSGPSPGKLALDGLLALEVPRLVERLRPDVLIAHHVEAAAACELTRTHADLYVAHTTLREELGSYFPARLEGACRRLGGALDRRVCRGAARVASVAPELSRLLAAQTGARVHTLRVPWPLARPHTPSERSNARAELGFGAADQVALYAGNLDAYQGLPRLLSALACAAERLPRLKLLIATASERGELAPRFGSRVRFAPLASERDRRFVHAAADVALVVRERPGGLPVKLLDALARGSWVIATRRASAGLALEGACRVTEDGPEALAEALVEHFAEPRAAIHENARDYVRREHAPALFVEDLQRALG